MVQQSTKIPVMLLAPFKWNRSCRASTCVARESERGWGPALMCHVNVRDTQNKSVAFLPPLAQKSSWLAGHNVSHWIPSSGWMSHQGFVLISPSQPEKTTTHGQRKICNSSYWGNSQIRSGVMDVSPSLSCVFLDQELLCFSTLAH